MKSPIKSRWNPLKRSLLALVALGLIPQSILIAPSYAQDTQPSEYSSVVRYDDRGRVTGTIAPDPDGTGPIKYAATRTTYNAIGLPLKMESGELATWQPTSVRPRDWSGFTVFLTEVHVYNSMNRKIKSVVTGDDDVVQSVTQTSYDQIGRPLCTAVRMNPSQVGNSFPNACVPLAPVNGVYDRITKNIYDKASQVTQVRKAVGTPIEQAYATYTYSWNGQQTTVRDANGNLASMAYDGHDRQIRWNFPHKTNTGTTSTTDYEAYTYDANGNRKTLRKRDGRTITYNYDALNRVVSKTDPDTLTPHVYYGYDNRDLQTYARFGSAAGNGIDIVYDGFGRIKETTNRMFATPRKLSYQYDKNGNRTRITHPDNKYFTYDYDKLDRITQIKENGSAVLTTNVYNDRGLPDAMTRTGATTSYSYDAASRPSGSVHNLGGTYGDVTYGFGYNTASQIVSKSISNKAYITNSHYNIDRQYTTNGLNQYTAAGPASFTYDDNGNLTTDGDTTYAYDIENRLVTARGKKEANLIYDPMGRLFETNANSSLAQTTTQFLYDGDALVAEYSDAGTLLHRYVHAGGVDSPVVWYIGATVGSGSRSHLHANWQGSITAVTDANASVQWINGYDAYGIPNWFNEGRFQYTGQIMIPELEMYHYKARVYSPTMGRFLQTDPIGYEDQVNLYAYVGNDPIGNIDPTGERTCKSASCQREMFRKAGLDPNEVDRYRSKHSSFVTGALFAAVPIGEVGFLSKLGASAFRLKAAAAMPKLFGLSDKATRGIYKGLISKIPASINKSQPLVGQARQAHKMRNEVRTFARSIMRDRKKVGNMDRDNPNLSFDDQVSKIMKVNNYKNLDQAYRHMIGSSARSNRAVDKKLGF